MEPIITLDTSGVFTLALDTKDCRGVGVMMENTCPDGSYSIEVSLDSYVWAEQATVTKVASEPFFIDFTNVSARYFRLVGPSDLTGAVVKAQIFSQYS